VKLADERFHELRRAGEYFVGIIGINGQPRWFLVGSNAIEDMLVAAWGVSNGALRFAFPPTDGVGSGWRGWQRQGRGGQEQNKGDGRA
jgi:hypothetical protein